MYASVLLCTAYKVPLWYAVPSSVNVQKGNLVKVSLRAQIVTGIVLFVTYQKPKITGILKEIIALEILPDDPYYFQFIHAIAQIYRLEPIFFVKRIQQFLHENITKDAVQTIVPQKSVQMPLLTEQQEKICTFLHAYIVDQKHIISLLHGVTGSGKTEVYKRCILTAQSNKKTVIFLLPEVTLAMEFEHRLRAEMPHQENIMGFHSGKTSLQKKQLWQKLIEEKSLVIIGVHLPILLPIHNLGLIIIDEEHDSGFQEKKHPKINSKEIALFRAKIAQVPVLLGSATPSIRSLYAVKQGKWKFFQLTQRFNGTFPTITMVGLKEEKEKRRQFWITDTLKHAIATRLQKKEQTILFLNRRGFSFFVQCKFCAYICMCLACSVSLTLHEKDILHCHYCSFKMVLPKSCSACKVEKQQWLKKGIGTQQAVVILQELFPQATIVRADMDTTSKKKIWEKTIENIKNGTVDIIVGTQTVTKGYHFPKVTLVGVLWADMQVHLPLFNATELAVQQLIQVAGRAGRSSTESQVIVQMMDNHTITDFLHEVDYLQFFKKEIDNRTALNYPPVGTLVEIELKHKNEFIIEKEAHHLATLLHQHKNHDESLTILGPVQNIVHKIQHVESRIIFIKGHSLNTITMLYKKIPLYKYESNIFFTPRW
ncbi:MAG TPA: primosomal protein N' [Patescibacteria group bacterium]|jgi:primosomal protein N' (replication factor Y)|nr:primosomal protein N' [Patescibacteria group bacterium]